jgi:hypothetical protein
MIALNQNQFEALNMEEMILTFGGVDPTKPTLKDKIIRVIDDVEDIAFKLAMAISAIYTIYTQTKSSLQ